MMMMTITPPTFTGILSWLLNIAHEITTRQYRTLNSIKRHMHTLGEKRVKMLNVDDGGKVFHLLIPHCVYREISNYGDNIIIDPV